MSYIVRYGKMIPGTIRVACGAEAEFDDGSGIGHRCTTCGAVIGSIGMPRECARLEKEADEKREIWKSLGGKQHE